MGERGEWRKKIISTKTILKKRENKKETYTDTEAETNKISHTVVKQSIKSETKIYKNKTYKITTTTTKPCAIKTLQKY